LADLQRIAADVVNESHNAVPEITGQGRHQLNRRLLTRDWSKAGAETQSRGCFYDGSENLVIAFEGTGSFEARLTPATQRFVEILTARGYNTNDPSFEPAALISEALQNRERRNVRWSGVARGILSQISRNSSLSARTQWMSFPSEETELLADLENYKKLSPGRLVREMISSSSGNPENIHRASSCLVEMLEQAQAQGKSPKVVVVSHSSGGRAAVKFAESVKALHDPRTGRVGVKIDLMYTIDPVRDAHEVVLQATREVLNKGTEHNANRLRGLLGRAPRTVYPPHVVSVAQPQTLYRVDNVHRHLNFYQSVDQDGLKVGPQFGIHGSPMLGADVNHHLNAQDGLGSAAHGEITLHPRVLRTFEDELKRLNP
jgi:hypothetical protein